MCIYVQQGTTLILPDFHPDFNLQLVQVISFVTAIDPFALTRTNLLERFPLKAWPKPKDTNGKWMKIDVHPCPSYVIPIFMWRAIYFWYFLEFLVLFFFCSLLSLLLCFSAFPASLLFCFLAFLLLSSSATVLLCLSTYSILLILFLSHVFLLLYFLLLCFSASCLAV